MAMCLKLIAGTIPSFEIFKNHHLKFLERIGFFEKYVGSLEPSSTPKILSVLYFVNTYEMFFESFKLKAPFSQKRNCQILHFLPVSPKRLDLPKNNQHVPPSIRMECYFESFKLVYPCFRNSGRKIESAHVYAHTHTHT